MHRVSLSLSHSLSLTHTHTHTHTHVRVKLLKSEEALRVHQYQVVGLVVSLVSQKVFGLGETG